MGVGPVGIHPTTPGLVYDEAHGHRGDNGVGANGFFWGSDAGFDDEPHLRWE